MKKKSLIMLLCAIVILTSVAFGTIAYLTDRESVTNKFTMGNVDIVVDEEDIDSDPDDPKRTEEGNEYDIEPGGEYKKDPTMTVKAGSKPAYVRMVVELSHANALDTIFSELKIMYPERYTGEIDLSTCVDGWDATIWPCTSMEKVTRMEQAVVEGVFTQVERSYYVLEFRYPEVVTANGTDLVLPALFQKLLIPGELTGVQLEKIQDMTIEVYGHAIQATGFLTAEDAWTAFDAQALAEDKLSTLQPSVGQ